MYTALDTFTLGTLTKTSVLRISTLYTDRYVYSRDMRISRILLHQRHDNRHRLRINTTRHRKRYTESSTRSSSFRMTESQAFSQKDIREWASRGEGRGGQAKAGEGGWSTSILCFPTHCSDVGAVTNIDTQNSLQCRNSFRPEPGQISLNPPRMIILISAHERYRIPGVHDSLESGTSTDLFH